jgi:hypothetical protein
MFIICIAYKKRFFDLLQNRTKCCYTPPLLNPPQTVIHEALGIVNKAPDEFFVVVFEINLQSLIVILLEVFIIAPPFSPLLFRKEILISSKELKSPPPHCE